MEMVCRVSLLVMGDAGVCCRIAMETAGLGMAGVGYQYVAPNHIVRAPIH